MVRQSHSTLRTLSRQAAYPLGARADENPAPSPYRQKPRSDALLVDGRLRRLGSAVPRSRRGPHSVANLRKSRGARLRQGIARIYCRVLWEQQDDFLRGTYRLTKPSAEFAGDLIAWKNGSVIRGVPSGEAQMRTFHPRLFLIDEGAFLEGFAASWGAAESVASKIVAISSAAPSEFGTWVTAAS